jgi:hypothetical protein
MLVEKLIFIVGQEIPPEYNKPVISLPLSQELAACPCLEPEESN